MKPNAEHPYAMPAAVAPGIRQEVADRIDAIEDAAFACTNIEEYDSQAGQHSYILMQGEQVKGANEYHIYRFDPNPFHWEFRGTLLFPDGIPQLTNSDHFLDTIGRDKWELVEDYDDGPDTILVVAKL